MRKVKTLGLLGTGVIGGGWAARALHFGIDVIAADVKPEMEEWIRGAVANAEPALARLTFAPLPPKGKLSFTTDLKVMAQRADFIGSVAGSRRHHCGACSGSSCPRPGRFIERARFPVDSSAAYTSQTRTLTITMVPLLVSEMQATPGLPEGRLRAGLTAQRPGGLRFR